MKTLVIALTTLMIAIAAVMFSRPREPFRAGAEFPRPGVLFEGVVLSEHTPDGDVVVEIGEVARAPGRIGFFRSPLVPGVELRDVTVRRDGEVVERRDLVHLSGRDVRGKGDLGELVSSWTASLLPEKRDAEDGQGPLRGDARAQAEGEFDPAVTLP